MFLVWFYSKKNLSKLINFEYYKTAFEDLKKSGITIIYFYKENNSILIADDLTKKLDKIWVSIKSYNNIDEILKYLKSLNWKIFINTFEEQEIPIANEIKRWLWQEISDNPEIFVNKYLQRKLIWEKYPETVVNFEVFPFEKINDFKETEFLHTPLIIKPTWGVQSSWVHKIQNMNEFETAIKDIPSAFEKLKEKNLLNQKVLIEEFIDWKMYTVDYFVDEFSNFQLTAPVYVKLWIDYWIDDFCNIVRYMSEWEVIDQNKLLDFVKKTVKWAKIKNTFIHHEFKINSKWIFKTIEINWRIWWYRLDMYNKWYGINLLKFPFSSDKKELKLLKNIAVFALYPKYEWVFKWIHNNLIENILKLPSLDRLKILENQIWNEVWFTKNWYSKLGTIVLANNDYQQFKKDSQFLENNYFDMLQVDKF